MRDCLILINNDGTVETSCAQQYIGEHAATRLVITLNDELTADGISYHTLCFNMGAYNANPFKIKFCSDIITESSDNGYIQDGIIYFTLPKALTQCRNLTVQVEAHTTDEEQTVTKIIKSPAFTIPFSYSVDGEEDIIPEKSFELIEELRKALTKINASISEINLNTDARHTHSNKATLNALNCKVLQNGGIYSSDSDFDLTFEGKSVRLKADGSVISTVTEIERNGATYLRLGLSAEKNSLVSSFPTYIDIPVSAVTATEETDENGVVVNGSELDLGINEQLTEAQVEQIVADYLAENPIESGATITDDGEGNVTIAQGGTK